MAEETQEQEVVTYSLKVDGQELFADGKTSVLSIDVHKMFDRIPTARIAIHDGDPAAQDFVLSGGETFKPGAAVEIGLGFGTETVCVFKGFIVSHSIRIRTSGDPLLVLEAKDPAAFMTSERRSRYFDEKSKDSDVFDDIIKENAKAVKSKYGSKLKLEAGTIDATTVEHDQLVQFNSTDWDFLLQRAHANGLHLVPDNGVLTIADKIKTPDTDVELTIKFGDNLHELDGEIDASGVYDSVESLAWQTEGDELTNEAAATGDSKVTSNAETTASDLSAAQGNAKRTVRFGANLPRNEVVAHSKAEMQHGKLSAYKGRIRILGNNKVKPGLKVKLEGLGASFNGNIVATGVSQCYSDKGWYTDLFFGMAGSLSELRQLGNGKKDTALVPRMGGLHVGRITKVSGDPNSEFRVQVTMPMIDKEKDGVWAHVAGADAGKKHGIMFIPDVDDYVIVGHLDDDPRHPVVLGSFHHKSQEAPLKAADENNYIRGIYTKSGIKLTFDDENGIVDLITPEKQEIKIDDKEGKITITDKTKNVIEMSDSAIAITGKKDITLTADGDVTIKGKNVTLEASAAFKAKGSSGANLEASGTTVVKGATVNIN